MLSIYAFQTGCCPDEKEQFWQELQDNVSSCPAEDVVLLCGDLNGPLETLMVDTTVMATTALVQEMMTADESSTLLMTMIL